MSLRTLDSMQPSLTDGEGEAEAEADAGGGTPRSLEMENARLRAEVATQYAHEAARSLLTGDGSHMAASMQRSLQIGETQVSCQLARPGQLLLYREQRH